jgi:hypothetical protein
MVLNEDAPADAIVVTGSAVHAALSSSFRLYPPVGHERLSNTPDVNLETGIDVRRCPIVPG